MNSLPTVHTSFVHPYVDYLTRNGCPVHRYLRMAKLPEGLLDLTDGFVSERYLYQLLNIAAHREGIDDFGLQVAQTVPIEALGELGEQMATMPTLYASLDLFCRKICEEVISHVGFWLTRRDGQIWFCRTPPPCLDSGLKHPEQFAVLFMIKLIRKFSGQNWSPKEVWLRSNKKNEFIDHPCFKNTEIRFDKNVTAVALPAPTDQSSMVQYRLTPPGMVLGNINQSLRKVLKLYLSEGYPDIEIAANLTGLSSRTLKRRLAKRNITFRGMIRQIRFEQACQMLETTDASMMDIAYELSYKSPSNFARAFRQWAGVSPREFRLSNHHNGTGSTY